MSSDALVETPFGPPSDVIVRGRLGDTTLLFLPRHGRGHRIAPHKINSRANVCALKKLGATHLVSISAVGSMKEDIAPGRLRRRRSVHRPDQATDSTFFERRSRRSRRLRRPCLRGSVGGPRGRSRARRRPGPPRRHVRLHRGPAVLDARREPALPLLGSVGHRDDGDARGEARARSRAPLRAARPCDRLRLLAPEPRRTSPSRPSSRSSPKTSPRRDAPSASSPAALPDPGDQPGDWRSRCGAHDLTRASRTCDAVAGSTGSSASTSTD